MGWCDPQLIFSEENQTTLRTTPAQGHSPLAQATEELIKAVSLVSKSYYYERGRIGASFCSASLEWGYCVKALGYVTSGVAKFKFLPLKKNFDRICIVAIKHGVSSVLAVKAYQVSIAGKRAVPSTWYYSRTPAPLFVSKYGLGTTYSSIFLYFRLRVWRCIGNAIVGSRPRKYSSSVTGYNPSSAAGWTTDTVASYENGSNNYEGI